MRLIHFTRLSMILLIYIIVSLFHKCYIYNDHSITTVYHGHRITTL